MLHEVFPESPIPGLPVRQGKVRDIYDLGDKLMLVASDRISAFDWVLPSRIPDKGRVLTELSTFWFNHLATDSHLDSTDVDKMPFPAGVDREPYRGRTTLVRKMVPVPIECVVRGYLAGSGWKEYKQHGTVCGIKLPPGLREADKLAEPIFTPATKEGSGHDINISFATMCRLVGQDLSEELRDRSISVYAHGATYALESGIIIADTKFEWGQDKNQAKLIDEVLTSDSSRFWPADQYRPGSNPPSFDKQFVRDWLETTEWDKNSSPPPLPPDIIEQTRAKYIQAYELLTGQPFPWK